MFEVRLSSFKFIKTWQQSSETGSETQRHFFKLTLLETEHLWTKWCVMFAGHKKSFKHKKTGQSQEEHEGQRSQGPDG